MTSKRDALLFDSESMPENEIDNIKAELEDHLIAINETTNEIQANNELIVKLSDKLDKIAERLEKIEIFLQEKANFMVENKHFFDVKPLTKREKEVFMVLYSLEPIGFVTYIDIGRRVGLTEDLAASYLTNMIEKGIPILKKYVNGKAHVKLNAHFKEVQAKHNILKIEQKDLVSF